MREQVYDERVNRLTREQVASERVNLLRCEYVVCGPGDLPGWCWCLSWPVVAL